MSRRIEDLYMLLVREADGADGIVSFPGFHETQVCSILTGLNPQAVELLRLVRKRVGHDHLGRPVEIVRFYDRRDLTAADLPDRLRSRARGAPMIEAWCAATYDAHGDESLPAMQIVVDGVKSMCPPVGGDKDRLASYLRERFASLLFQRGQVLFKLVRRETIEG